MKMIGNRAGMRLRMNVQGVALVACATLASTAGAQRPTQVVVRGTLDTLKTSDSTRLPSPRVLFARQRKVDSLTKLQEGTTIGSPEYVRINEELRAAFKAILPGGAMVLTPDGGLTITFTSPGDSTARSAVARRKEAVATGHVGEMPGVRMLMRDVEPRGWLGISTDGVVWDWTEPDGHYYRYFVHPVVVSVEPNSPAAKVGVQFGDSLIAYNGMDLRTNTINLTRLLEPGRPVRVSLRRDGENKELSIIPDKVPASMLLERRTTEQSRTLMPSRAPMAGDTDRVLVERRVGAMAGAGGRGVGTMGGPVRAPAMAVGFRTPGLLGASMTDLSPAAVTSLTQQKQTHGVLVNFVPVGSPAARMGLLDGDIIITVGDVDAIALAQVSRELNLRSSNRATQFVVYRQGKTEKLTYEPK